MLTGIVCSNRMAYRESLALFCVLACLRMQPVSAETIRVPIAIDGETVHFAVRIHAPDGPGPFPTAIFHHGGTGTGRDPALFRAPFDPPSLRAYFTSRGWALILPSRRGRGGSEGLYDEGFSRDRTEGYSCEKAIALAGANRALRDIDAVTADVLRLPAVDRDRVIVGGVSRGGVLAIAHAGRQPKLFKGVINFVGGWLASDARCGTASEVNQALFRLGASYPGPTLWLYGDADSRDPLAHSRSNFEAFQSAEGRGLFRDYRYLGGLDWHFIFLRQHLWEKDVDAYLRAQGLPVAR